MYPQRLCVTVKCVPANARPAKSAVRRLPAVAAARYTKLAAAAAAHAASARTTQRSRPKVATSGAARAKGSTGCCTKACETAKACARPWSNCQAISRL